MDIQDENLFLIHVEIQKTYSLYHNLYFPAPVL